MTHVVKKIQINQAFAFYKTAKILFLVLFVLKLR